LEIAEVEFLLLEIGFCIVMLTCKENWYCFKIWSYKLCVSCLSYDFIVIYLGHIFSVFIAYSLFLYLRVFLTSVKEQLNEMITSFTLVVGSDATW